MSKKPRRIIVVYAEMQRRYAIYAVVHSTTGMIASTFLLALMLLFAEDVEGPFIGAMTAVLITLVLGTIVWTTSIRVSNRIAGPVFRLSRSLREIGEGKLDQKPIVLRKGDEWSEAIADYNNMIHNLQAQRSASMAAYDKLRSHLDAGNAELARKALDEMRTALRIT